jgi:hypothetical protein
VNFDEMSLEELIASQRKDQRTGHRVNPEGLALDAVMESGATRGEVWLSNEGYMRAKMDRRRNHGCALHGWKYYAPSGKCSECDRVRKWNARRAAGVPLRRKREECGHGEDKIVYYGRNKVCKECDRIRSGEYYRRNKERILAQKKAKALELRAKGLSTRKRPLPRPELPPGVKLIAWYDEEDT